VDSGQLKVVLAGRPRHYKHVQVAIMVEIGRHHIDDLAASLNLDLHARLEIPVLLYQNNTR
jgi:hypothetical protein